MGPAIGAHRRRWGQPFGDQMAIVAHTAIVSHMAIVDYMTIFSHMAIVTHTT